MGKVVLLGPTQCDFCGTEFVIARYRNLPYAVAGLLAVIFILTWLTGKLSGILFLILCGVWLTFDLIWENVAPLKRVKSSQKDPQAPVTESGRIADEPRSPDTKKIDVNKLIS